jgi:hypothetical protein
MEEALKEVVIQLKQQNEELVKQNRELFKIVTEGQAVKHEKKNIEKLEKPVKFNGERDAVNIENWVYSVRQYVKALRLQGEDSVIMAVSFLDGLAKQYWRNYTEKLEKDKEAGASGDYTLLTNLDSMLELIRQRFFPSELAQDVRNQLEKLEQTTSAKVYSQKFEALLMQLPSSDYAEADMVDKFIRGLKYEVRKQVLLDGPVNLLAAIQAAERVDGILFQLKNGGRNQGNQGNQRRDFNPRHRQLNRQPRNADDMDIDAIEENRRNQGRHRNRDRGPVYCYVCGQEGHVARNCPNRHRAPTASTASTTASGQRPATEAGNGQKN